MTISKWILDSCTQHSAKIIIHSTAAAAVELGETHPLTNNNCSWRVVAAVPKRIRQICNSIHIGLPENGEYRERHFLPFVCKCELGAGEVAAAET